MMDSFSVIGAIIIAVLAAGMLYLQIRSRPEQFSGANIHKSLFTLGVLAVVLMVFLAFIVIGMQTTSA